MKKRYVEIDSQKLMEWVGIANEPSHIFAFSCVCL